MIKRIDFKEGKIKGVSGKTYFIEKDVGVVRFQEFEKLQSHVGFGLDFHNVFNKLKDAYTDLNKSKPADAAIKLHNLMNGISMRLEDRNHPIMEMCALFINEEDENRAEFDRDKMGRKIDDWKEYSVEDFFQLAFNLVGGFIPIYEEISLNISQEKKKEKLNTTKSK